MRLIKKKINIDSRDRNTDNFPSPSNYRVRLPDIYRRVHSIKLRNIELPNSFYTFSSLRQNVTMRVSVTATNDEVVTHTVTIKNGNYIIDATAGNGLLTGLRLKLNDLFGDIANFTSSIDEVTNFVVLSCTRPFSIDTTFGAKEGSAYYGLGYFLGFPLSASINSVGSANVITGSFFPQGSPDNYLIMELDLLNSLDELALNDRGSGRSNGAFAKIVIDSNPGQYIIQNDSSHVLGDTVLYPPRERLTTLDVRFRFHDGTIVDFNNIDHSFLLEIEYEP